MKSSVFAVLLIGLAFVASPAAADDSAIAAKLKDLGGKVTETAGVVTKLEFADCTKLGESDFQSISQLQGITELNLGKGPNVNDAALASIAKLSNLEKLGSNGIQVSDEGLKQLGNLKNLRSIAFFHTSLGMKGFTGVGFGSLRECPKLENLTIAGIPITDEGYAAVATITQLKGFRTWHTFQTAAAYESIGKLTNLESLTLGQRLPRGKSHPPSLTEAAIPQLLGLKALKSLNLNEVRLTAASLAQLKGLPSLKKLTLMECDLPAGDIDQLRKDLPNVSIDYKPLTDEERTKLDKFLAD